MYEYYEALLKKYGVTTYQVAKATGISTASFTGWKQGKWNFKSDKLQRIADYFGVPLSYLLTGEMEEDVKETTLTPKDKRDIAKDLDNIMRKLASSKLLLIVFRTICSTYCDHVRIHIRGVWVSTHIIGLDG